MEVFLALLNVFMKGYSCLEFACTGRIRLSSFREVLGPFVVVRARTS